MAVVGVAECDESLSPGLIGRNTGAEIEVARRITQGVEQAAEGIIIVTVMTGGAQTHSGAISQVDERLVADACWIGRVMKDIHVADLVACVRNSK